MTKWIMLALLCLLASPALSLERRSMQGTVHVIDGDTVTLHGSRDVERVRLIGIDAPEEGQTCARGGRRLACGDQATEVLVGLAEGRPATCDLRGLDIYGRALGVCRVGGRDIGGAMVRQGHAVTYRDDPTYAAEEARARGEGLGLWSTDFVDPAAYRARPPVGAVAATQGCAIKGNISSNGRIFHMPGQEHYARTGIREERGERWFCSPEDAIAAGWRPARR